ncbi:MAG: hypothetical protein Ct9H90mP27_2520 [Gammaproteobacteria bacterium]|nr:MAG: hypothetical protein Ct9H90mP27_2520 [Gammaproteobacteria bacterium]
MIAICLPYDENAPAAGNGNMIAIPGGSREGVEKTIRQGYGAGSE